MAFLKNRPRRAPLSVGLLASTLAVACSSDNQTPPAPDMAQAFNPNAPSAYTAKVKNLLTGQAPSDAELMMVSKDPTALKGLIDTWMAQPEFSGKMFSFFQQAFQQTQLVLTDFEPQLGRTTLTSWSGFDKVAFVNSAAASFSLTALQLIKEGQPFTSVVTTTRFMLNPPLMSTMALIDNLQFDDNGNAIPAPWFIKKYPTFHYTRQITTPNTIEQVIDPADTANFMNWYDPKPYSGVNANCAKYPLTILPGATNKLLPTAMNFVADYIYGGRPGCGSTVSQFTAADYQSWKMVNVRAPKAGETPDVFFNLPHLRDPNLTELVTSTPRVGFLSTLAFLANWQTNLSNQARVTMNQALIVALGHSLADPTAAVPITETGNADNLHVAPGTACYVCHKTLDPMRDFIRQSFTVSYHTQPAGVMPTDGTQAEFILDSQDVKGTGGGVAELANIMTQSPRFATAWTNKLCQYANSASCSPDDPEFLRVAAVFQSSKYDFHALVRELFSSPLVTQAAATKTTMDVGNTVSVERREHFCASLSNRLHISDACQLQPTVATTVQNDAFGIPGAAYSRGSETPLMPRDPDLFFASAVENLCGQIAAQIVDNTKCAAPTTCFTSAAAPAAIGAFVRTLMAVPASDPRAADLTAILTDHFNAAKGTAGITATSALQSTFVLACSSPLAAASGL